MILSSVKYISEALNLSKFNKFYYFEEGVKKSIQLSAYAQQNITFSNTITDNAVEFGINLADTTFRNPVVIKAFMLVSDTEGLIGRVVDIVKDLFAGDSLTDNIKAQGIRFIDADSSGLLKSSKTYNKLITISQNFLSCEIITRDRLYRNLQIVSINRNVVADNYGGMIAEVELKEILTFNTEENNLLDENPTQNGFGSLREIGQNALARFQ